MLDKTTLYNNILSEMATVTLGDGSKPFDQSSVQPSGKMMVYNGVSATGFDVLVHVIADKVIEHILSNLKTSLVERFDLLESDFDSFVQKMLTVGVGPATAVPAGVTAFLATSNTIQRGTKKIATATEGTNILYGK